MCRRLLVGLSIEVVAWKERNSKTDAVEDERKTPEIRRNMFRNKRRRDGGMATVTRKPNGTVRW